MSANSGDVDRNAAEAEENAATAGASDVPAAGHDRFPDWLGHPVEEVARRLLGCVLVRDLPATEDRPAARVRVRIVETEAYDQTDPASHAYHGKLQRNRALFGPSGHCYVYFTYGMWHCLNVTAGQDGFGAGALIRAVEPVDERSRAILEARRGKTGPMATNGPAKLCEALGIDAGLYGHDLREPPLRLVEGGLEPGEQVQVTARIGIRQAADWPRRYAIRGNAYVSRFPHSSHAPRKTASR